MAKSGDAPTTCPLETSETPVVSSARDSSIVADDRYSLGIIADAYGVYWRSTEGNVRMLAHGTAGPRTLFQGTADVAISTDADAIYFHGKVDDSYLIALLRLERNATEPRILAGLSIETSTWGPILDAERVYFMNGSQRIASVPKLGGEPVDTVIDAGHFRGLAVDDTHLYWLDSTYDVSDLKRVAKTGGPEELLASGFKNAALPQVVGDSVLFVAEHGLFAVPKTGGCARTVIWDDDNRVVGFVVSSDQIYYKRVFNSDTGHSSVLRAPLAGGNAVELTRGDTRSGAQGLAFYGDRLYWTGDAAVYVFEL